MGGSRGNRRIAAPGALDRLHGTHLHACHAAGPAPSFSGPHGHPYLFPHSFYLPGFHAYSFS
jgi:hypothetical protein